MRSVSCVFVYSISDPSKHDGWRWRLNNHYVILVESSANQVLRIENFELH